VAIVIRLVSDTHELPLGAIRSGNP